ncbi:MAG TPA: asparaginase [Rubrivivax sp.]|nr:asparaginase [Rubrivivax sp.]HPO17704.1 asparaginase [Rubrivivax sp.]
MQCNPVLVEAWRGGSVESAHRGAFAVVDAAGALVCALGDVERPVFPRSAVKLLQALPLVASGAADALRLSDEELALACASHNGEPAHVAAAAAMLAKAGVDATVLECGAHWPYHEALQRQMAARGETPTPLHNNCSGKHAGFVCLGCVLARGGAGAAAPPTLREFAAGYVRAEHPLMREITQALQAATGCDLRHAPQGTDGCSIPTYGIALRHLALAFARVATGVGLDGDHARAARRLRQAVAKAPFMVAGSGRFDTRVMQRLGERVCCKVGAEGMYCAALPERGLGVALKIDDGNNARAAEVVMAALIERFVTLDRAEAGWLHGFSELGLRNWNGIPVGRLAASTGLREGLSRA